MIAELRRTTISSWVEGGSCFLPERRDESGLCVLTDLLGEVSLAFEGEMARTGSVLLLPEGSPFPERLQPSVP